MDEMLANELLRIENAYNNYKRHHVKIQEDAQSSAKHSVIENEVNQFSGALFITAACRYNSLKVNKHLINIWLDINDIMFVYDTDWINSIVNCAYQRVNQSMCPAQYLLKTYIEPIMELKDVIIDHTQSK